MMINIEFIYLHLLLGTKPTQSSNIYTTSHLLVFYNLIKNAILFVLLFSLPPPLYTFARKCFSTLPIPTIECSSTDAPYKSEISDPPCHILEPWNNNLNLTDWPCDSDGPGHYLNSKGDQPKKSVENSEIYTRSNLIVYSGGVRYKQRKHKAGSSRGSSSGSNLLDDGSPRPGSTISDSEKRDQTREKQELKKGTDDCFATNEGEGNEEQDWEDEDSEDLEKRSDCSGNSGEGEIDGEEDPEEGNDHGGNSGEEENDGGEDRPLNYELTSMWTRNGAVTSQPQLDQNVQNPPGQNVQNLRRQNVHPSYAAAAAVGAVGAAVGAGAGAGAIGNLPENRGARNVPETTNTITNRSIGEQQDSGQDMNN